MAKKKTYLIIHTNCDCGSGEIARPTNHSRWLYGPRCPFCLKILGMMSWSIIEEIKATNQDAALDEYYSQRRKKLNVTYDLHSRLKQAPKDLKKMAKRFYGNDWRDATIECYESHVAGDCPLCGAE